MYGGIRVCRWDMYVQYMYELPSSPPNMSFCPSPFASSYDIYVCPDSFCFCFASFFPSFLNPSIRPGIKSIILCFHICIKDIYVHGAS